ncbi:MAG: bacillithiol biosynthesis cysteine-adding enzyme BshC [Bacteroidetes bacterium]|nr:bacillithiol biosynthesis cysteine-adding enzyme BshC [Bacteroidota bacterium]
MKITTYSRKDFNYYSNFQLQLSENQEALNEFIGSVFSIESIKEQIKLKQKSFSRVNRNIIQTHFKNQYTNLSISESIKNNISLLGEENTFTITTGHQLTLFGGPAFFFYKIIHCISLTKKLKEVFPEFNFIPVFWLASEDHDKEEISEATIFNQTFLWENQFNGATGDFPLDDKFQILKNSIQKKFSSNEECEILRHLNEFNGANLSEAFVHFLTSIFKDYGLLVLDANSPILKNELSGIIKNEINEFSTFTNVSETNEQLQKKGIKPQAKIQQINFFKLEKGHRLKINFSNNKYYISDREISKDELLFDAQTNPESFSPNVFLRPLYQELILPNLAYIGGPNELSYWLQLKKNFDFYKIPFPLLVNRLSLFVVESSTEKKMKNFSFSILDFINSSFDDLKKSYLSNTQDFKNLDWIQTDTKLQGILLDLKNLYASSAPEISNFLNSEWRTIEKSVEKIKSKLEKQVAVKHTVSLNQIEQIKSKLTPNSTPQEKFYHFFTFCPDGTLKLMHKLIEKIDPFNPNILIVTD